MQFTARLLALSAAVSQVLALPVLTNSAYDVTEGTPFDITWTNATGSVTLLLKTGASTDLSTVFSIGSGLTGDSYEWTPESIPSGTYAIAISDDSGETNYSPQFSYQGTGVAATTTTTSTSATATTTTTSVSSGSASSTVTSASSTITSTVTGSSNGTTTASSTLSKTTKSSSETSTTASSSSSTSTPVNTNDSQKMGSPLALILLTAAALVICH